MTTLHLTFIGADWVVLGLLALVPALMFFGIYSIRRELRAAACIEAKRAGLKTTDDERRQWRRVSQSQEMINLLDDLDTLLKQINTNEAAAARDYRDHKEALRLSWESRHIPFGTLLIGGLALAGMLSAIFMVIAQGPANPIP
jgi:hypothetical protein